VDFWTGQRHAGGQSVARDYALDEFPLHVRAGSIVPMGPDVQHTGERLDAPWEIRVYPGADTGFTLYDDDGETYAYERGECSTVVLRWDDARRVLRIAARQGRYPGMPRQRELRVRLMASPGQGERTTTVHYRGRAMTLHLGDGAPS
jgi:alpha-D-xyloside xylohydrolase